MCGKVKKFPIILIKFNSYMSDTKKVKNHKCLENKKLVRLMF